MLRRSTAFSRDFGVEIECGVGGWDTDDYMKVGDIADEYGWELDEDGTEFELRSDIMCGKPGYAEVRAIMGRLREVGGYVTSADGLHVHHNAPEFVNDPKRCVQLVESWTNNQDAIHEMVAPRRRQSYHCPAWSAADLSDLRRWASDDPEYDNEWLDSDRNDLNLASLDEHGSIEFRLHEGTLDADVAIAWIQFGQRFIHDVVKRTQPMPKIGDGTEQALMRRIRLSPTAQAIIAAKKQAHYNTPATRFQSR